MAYVNPIINQAIHCYIQIKDFQPPATKDQPII